MNMKLKWGTAGRLRRGAVVLGVVGLAAGAAVATAGSALAANGTEPGHLTLSVPSGPLTTQPTWATSDACPTGFQGSAVIEEFNTDGTAASRVSLVVAPSSGPISGGGLLDTVGNLLTSSNITPGGTVEWAVACYSAVGGTGNFEYVQSTFVTENAAGTQYSTSATGPAGPANTSTALTASPNPAALNASVTLKAVVTSGSSFPAGTVQFENCPTPTTCTNINAAVPVNTGSVEVDATTSTSFATAGSVNLAAVFTASVPASFNGSTGTFSLSVGSTLAGGTNPVAISVTVPSTGTLSVTVGTGSVTLAPASPATTPDETATGTLNTVTISDTRNTTPGWSVSGQQSVFTGPGTNTIPANSLGWTPAFVGSAVGGAVIGPVVAPVGADTGSTGPGLGTAATLALAHAGTGIGTNNVNAGLLLDIPATTPPGAYSGTMTITYVSAQA
jgi:hypothetical protein